MKGKEVYCVHAELIKAQFRHIPIIYPKQGETYTIRSVHWYNSKPYPFYCFEEITNPEFRDGIEVNFPSIWFVDLDKIDISVLDQYMTIRKETFED